MEEKCDACTPEFDSEKAKDMSRQEIREQYPRFNGTCPKCGFYGAKYASMEHYVAGDW